MRKTEMPSRRGCTGNEFLPAPYWPFIGPLHKWNWSMSWNGNDKRVMPFYKSSSGIGRSGWRCYHCGKIVWDMTDREYALSVAEAIGLLPTFKQVLMKCEEVK